jgi:predicted dehydrogenase
MIRTAVIGLTQAGSEHAWAYRRDALSQLVGLCDADRAKSDELARSLGVPAFTDVAALLDATKPELVTVRSPLPDRAAAIRAVLAAGSSVLASLPLARETAEARDLAKVARGRGLVLAADFHLRFTPAVAKAREWLDAGRLGSPLFVNMNLWTKGELAAEPRELFRNLGAHGVDMMRQFCGEVRRVQCFGAYASHPRERAGCSSAQVNMEFADGTVGNLTLSYDMVPHHPMARCELAGTKARIVIENLYEEATLYPHADEEKRVVTNSIFGGIPQLRDTYARRIHRLLEQMAEKTPPEQIDSCAADALAAAAVMEAAIESLEHETVVEVAPS